MKRTRMSSERGVEDMFVVTSGFIRLRVGVNQRLRGLVMLGFTIARASSLYTFTICALTRRLPRGAG